MTLENIKTQLENKGVLLSDENILDQPNVIGYEKKFKWKWFATQLNTFIIASDLGDQTLSVSIMEKHLAESFNYAKKNYKGWPRGFQSGLAVINILISKNIEQDLKDYCTQLKVGKKFAGFSIPVVIDSNTGEVFCFHKNPIVGGIYYPHFKRLINEVTGK